MYTVHGEPLFFQHFDGPFYPTLKILHRCRSESSAARSLSCARDSDPLFASQTRRCFPE